MFSPTASPSSRGISAVYTVGFSGSGETVKTWSIGDPSADGTSRRVSRTWPLASTRNENGARPNPLLTAVTCKSTVA